MGDQDAGAALHELVERALDRGLGLVVDGRRRLVQDQDGRILQDGARQREPLALAARQLHAALAHRRAVALRQAADELVRLGRLRGAHDVGLRDIAQSIPDVLGHRAVGQEAVLRHVADRAAQLLQIERRDVDAVQADAARGGVVQPQQQLDQRALAAAGAADEGHRLAGRDAQRDAVERRPHQPRREHVCKCARIGAHGGGLVREAQVVEHQFPAHLRARQRAARVRDGHGRLQQVHHALDGGHRTLVEVGQVGQPRQRPQQALRQVDEGRVAADAQRAVQRHQAAVEQRHAEAGQDRDADHRRDRGRQPDRLAVALAVGDRGLGDVVRLEILGRVGLDRRDALQVVVQARGHRAGGLAHRGVADGQLALEPERAVQDQRHRDQRQRRELGGQHEEHAAHHQRADEDLDQVVGAAIEEALHLVDVLVEDGQQVAGAVALEVGHLQALHVGVRLHAHLVLQALRQAAPLELVEVFEQRLAEPDRDRQAGEQQQLLLRIGHAQPRQEGRLAIDDDIHRDADQQFGQHVEELVEHRIDGGQRDVAPIAAGVAEQAAQRMDGQAGWLGRVGHGRRRRRDSRCHCREASGEV